MNLHMSHDIQCLGVDIGEQVPWLSESDLIPKSNKINEKDPRSAVSKFLKLWTVKKRTEINGEESRILKLKESER